MAFKIAQIVMALVFLAGAAVQYNDPDPLWWVLIWLGAAVACVTALVRPGFWPLPTAVGAWALIWTLRLAPQAIPTFRVHDLVKTMETKTPAIELSRELLGLLIILIWMAVCAARAYNLRSAPTQERS